MNGTDVPAFRVRQWLPEWEQVNFDPARCRRRPDPFFYLFVLPAGLLRALSMVWGRVAESDVPRAEDLRFQRAPDKDRIDEIRRFVRHGFPWSAVPQAGDRSEEFIDLLKPGWLPNAIVVNMLRPGGEREGMRLSPERAVRMSPGTTRLATITLPDPAMLDDKGLLPFEIIDGQHRLWAFNAKQTLHDFELPVIAFFSLDLDRLAYVSATVNIKPVRLNASRALDLMPLQREETWLRGQFGVRPYDESRGQELIEALWLHPASPWHNRVSMLGDAGDPNRGLAAWYQSLELTYLKPASGRGISLGGAFGAFTDSGAAPLPWTGLRQAALLVLVWKLFHDAIAASHAEWATALRPFRLSRGESDPAISSQFGGRLGAMLLAEPGEGHQCLSLRRPGLHLYSRSLPGSEAPHSVAEFACRQPARWRRSKAPANPL